MESIIKINFRGGIVSPGSLIQIVEAAKEAGIYSASFGLRQQMILKTKADTQRGSKILELQEQLSANGFDYQIDTDILPNIISSYCAEEVFPTGIWLSEGIYKDIFDLFDFKPKLKINISDSNQSFTPFFSGNINFIASNIAEYWYVFVRPKQSNQILSFPNLIFTTDIPALCKSLENQLLKGNVNAETLFDTLINDDKLLMQPVKDPLVLPKFSLPYYEGFNRYGNKTWLGIYRRNETFSNDFLSDLCKLCLDTKIGQICLTPWKSLIIKGIENKDRQAWDQLLSKHAINVRHAANELNWQIEDHCHEGLSLKNYIIREFDHYDVRSFGLSFAVQTRQKSEVFGSIIIKSRKVLFGLVKQYDIYHATDFNPNTRSFQLFERGVNRMHVPEILQRLTKRYYAQLSAGLVLKAEANTAAEPAKAVQTVYQCPHCMSIYDKAYGDVFQNIVSGTEFKDLPSTYTCGICESPKADFLPINKVAEPS